MLLREEADWGLWSGLPSPARQPDSTAQEHTGAATASGSCSLGRLVLAGSAAVAQPSPGGLVASLHPAGGDGARSPREPELRAELGCRGLPGLFLPLPF